MINPQKSRLAAGKQLVFILTQGEPEARQQGNFGVPSFVVNGEPF